MEKIQLQFVRDVTISDGKKCNGEARGGKDRLRRLRADADQGLVEKYESLCNGRSIERIMRSYLPG